ncbi:MAG: hypothetical protein QNJ45_06725 [Ardenticatenaceae bacterium]|nr:hypothetical protein [Ardenticatenaceae bacterium]
MKSLNRFFLLLSLFFASVSVAYTAGPPDIVTNGDFSNGTNAWTIGAGSYSVPGGSCGADVLYIETVTGPFTVTEVKQCINITTPPSGDWTFAVGSASNSPDATGFVAEYRFSSQLNCIGATVGETNGNLRTINPMPGTITPISHPPAALSVEITIRLLPDFFSGLPSTGCIDDVSFTDSGGSATVVKMKEIDASPAPAGWPLLLISGFFFLLFLTTGPLFEKRSERQS